MTEKVTGSLSIQAHVNCPKCDEMIDLFQIETLKDDGFIWRALLGRERLGTKDLDQEIDCPKCGAAFQVGEIEY